MKAAGVFFGVMLSGWAVVLLGQIEPDPQLAGPAVRVPWLGIWTMIAVAANISGAIACLTSKRRGLTWSDALLNGILAAFWGVALAAGLVCLVVRWGAPEASYAVILLTTLATAVVPGLMEKWGPRLGEGMVRWAARRYQVPLDELEDDEPAQKR